MSLSAQTGDLPRRPAVRMPGLLSKVKPADTLIRKRRGSGWGAFFHADELRAGGRERFALYLPTKDTVALNTAQAFHATVLLTFADQLNLGESFLAGYGLVGANALNLNDAFLLADFSPSVTDELGLADSFAVQGDASLFGADEIELGEIIQATVAAKAADGIELGDVSELDPGFGVRDTLSLADGYQMNITLAAFLDTANLGDSSQLTSDSDIAAQDTLNLVDQSTFDLLLREGDTVNLADVATFQLGFTAQDTVNLAEITSAAISLRAPDSTELNDAFVLGLLWADEIELPDVGLLEGPPVTLKQLLVLGDFPIFVSETNTYERLTTDGGYLNETGTAEQLDELTGTDTINLAETARASISYPATDILNLNEISAFELLLTFFDVVNLGEISAISVSQSIADTVNLAETIAFVIGATFFDSVSLVDAYSISVSAGFVDSVNLVETTFSSISTIYADTVNLEESSSLTSLENIVGSDTLNLAETISATIEARALDTTQLYDSSVFGLGLVQANVLNLEEASLTVALGQVSASDTVNLVEALRSSIDHKAVDVVNLAEIIQASVSHPAVDVLNLAELAAANIEHKVTDVLNLADSGVLEEEEELIGSDSVNLADLGLLGLPRSDSMNLVETQKSTLVIPRQRLLLGGVLPAFINDTDVYDRITSDGGYLIEAALGQVSASEDVVNLDDDGWALHGNTQAIINAFTTPPTAARRTLIDTLVRALLSAFSINNLSQRFDILYVLAAADSQAAKINWVSPGSFTASEVNSPTFTANEGFRSNGSSSYLNTGWDVSNNGSTFSTNTGTFGVWVFSHATPTSAAANTFAFGATNNWMAPFASASAGSGVQYRITDSTTENAGTVTTHLGLTTVSRHSSTSQEIYKNGASIDTDTDTLASGSTTNDVYICCNNASGSPSGYYSGTIAIVFYGEDMTDAENTAVYDAFNAYISGL